MSKIILSYFSQSVTDYTPIDIGYIIATLKSNPNDIFDYNIQRFVHSRNYHHVLSERLVERKKTIDRDVDKVLQLFPKAVFIFVDSVTWSKVFALGRAIAIAKEIRRRDPRVFIGVCSYKIVASEGQQLVDSDVFDCVIIGDAEKAFTHLDKILLKYPIVGVLYSKKALSPTLIKTVPERSKDRADITGELDYIPSPYLMQIFDGFLAQKQKERKGRFMAFLTSARGCHFDCYYCSRSVKFEKVRYFSASRFYDEIEYLFNNFGIFRFFVLDDAFLLSKRRLKELKDEFTKRCVLNPDLDLIWLSVMARPESMDRQTIEFMADLRVRTVQIGLQTINPEIQHYMGRPIDVRYFKEIKDWLDEFRIALQLDVILGLPKDTIEWMKSTISYTISLSPAKIQMKQFYLNPFTLFHLDKEKYEIVTDNSRDVFDEDFDAPYVIQAVGIDEQYFQETSKFIRQQIESHPHIRWKYLSRRERFVSQAFYPRAKANLTRWVES